MQPRITKYNSKLIDKCKIKEAKFPPNIRPHRRQDNCFLKAEAGELNSFCKECIFVGKSKYSCLNHHLGSNGYMHNQGDGLDPKKLNQKQGIVLKVPTTKIIETGEAWVCHNSEAGARKIFVLSDKTPPCRWRVKKEKAKL